MKHLVESLESQEPSSEGPHGVGPTSRLEPPGTVRRQGGSCVLISALSCGLWNRGARWPLALRANLYSNAMALAPRGHSAHLSSVPLDASTPQVSPKPAFSEKRPPGARLAQAAACFQISTGPVLCLFTPGSQPSPPPLLSYPLTPGDKQLPLVQLRDSPKLQAQGLFPCWPRFSMPQAPCPPPRPGRLL